MREIKFRAWNIQEKRMIYDIQKEYDGKEEDCFAQFIEQDGPHGRIATKNKYIVMQYTGLKDKNDREIYEGDILEHQYYNPLLKKHETVKQTIKFCDLAAGDDMDLDSYGYHINPSWNGNYEVIGNIHEDSV